MLPWVEYTKIFIAVLVIVNPIGALPVFVSLTANQSTQDRRRTAHMTAFSVGVVLIIACLLGEWVLRFFGISMASFRVGGGILVMLLAIAMFNAQISGSKQTTEEATEAEHKSDIAVVPLAIPLLSGPGAISTVIIYIDQAPSWGHTGILIACCILVSLAVWLTLRLAIPIGVTLGKTGINIVTRLMGLVLAAIAVEIIVSGLGALLPGLVQR
ncbi:MAG: YchE family NAAT transporter [Syntrophobacteraceae bacterium]